MKTIEDLVGPARMYSKQEFVARFPDLFLLNEMPEDALDLKKKSFHTKVLATQEVAKRIERLEALRAEGFRLAAAAHRQIIFEVAKAPNRPFPDRFSIGRTNTCDISIPDGRISKLHAYIEHKADGAYVIVDAGSRNGTSVNQVKLAPKTQQPIRPGDVISLSVFEFKVVDAARLYDLIASWVRPDR